MLGDNYQSLSIIIYLVSISITFYFTQLDYNSLKSEDYTLCSNAFHGI